MKEVWENDAKLWFDLFNEKRNPSKGTVFEVTGPTREKIANDFFTVAYYWSVIRGGAEF